MFVDRFRDATSLEASAHVDHPAEPPDRRRPCLQTSDYVPVSKGADSWHPKGPPGSRKGLLNMRQD